MKHILTLAAVVFATACFGQEACPNVHDINSNGTIDIEDFLSILGLFADVDVDGDGVWDSQDYCLDATACNYLASPTEPCGYLDALGECGGACEGDGDGDGICDDVDTCVGELDECGVCNGPGPTEVVIEDVTILYDSVYAEPIDQWLVFEVGADTLFSFLCVPEFQDCGIVNYNGYDYETVVIGEQCWFAENLRTDKYRNGDVIPTGLTDNQWESTYSENLGARSSYGEGSGTCESYSPEGDACDESWSLSQYGYLYNGYAVHDIRSLCPDGWHVPDFEEWYTLGIQVTGYSDNLKSTFGWANGGNGSNSSGFKALPGGYRHYSASAYPHFQGAGESTLFWSSSIIDGEPRYFYLLGTASPYIHWNEYYLQAGMSVRCIQDSE